MTPIDALDSMLIMGLEKEANEAMQLILAKDDFDLDVNVNVFEVTIRLLGGLLSSYQHTSNPHLLHLAEDLGNRLLPAFQTATKMPYTTVNLRSGNAFGTVSKPADLQKVVGRKELNRCKNSSSIEIVLKKGNENVSKNPKSW